MVKIWQRYFLKEISKTLFLLLAVFWGLYVIIDYANKIAIFRTFQFTGWDICQYYLLLFLKRVEILLPFAFLIATIQTLIKFNTSHELTALMASGVPLKRLMDPFISFALFLMFLSFINLEWGYPYALARLHLLEDSRTSDEYKRSKSEGVESLTLDDGSSLLFYYLDTSTGRIDNLFWVQSIDTVYHMKRLYLFDEIPRGEWIEIFRRNDHGELVLAESHQQMPFPSMHLGDPKKALQLHSPQEQSLSTLYELFMEKNEQSRGKKRILLTMLIQKAMIPWLPLLVLMIAAPYCLIFSRTPPTFFIYVAGMFGLVGFYLIFNSLITLSEHHVFNPWWALALPFGLIVAITIWRYERVIRLY